MIESAESRKKIERIELGEDIALISTFKDSRYECDLILQSGGNIFDLRSFLPTNHRFRDSGEWAYIEGQKEVRTDLREIHRDKRNFFTLLHEIGHVVAIVRHGEEYSQKTTAAQYSSGKENYELVVADERNAWAEALQMARTLRAEGFDVFKLFEDSNDLMGWLRNTSLSTYEEDVHHDTAASKGWILDLFQKNELLRRNERIKAKYKHLKPR